MYGFSLSKGIIPLVILLALVSLVNLKNWQLLFDYYLLSNYLAFYPFNLRQKKLAEENKSLKRRRRSLKQIDESDDILEDEEQQENLSRRSKPSSSRHVNNDEHRKLFSGGDKTKDILTDWCISFLKHTVLLLGAPLIFLYYFLEEKN